MNTIEEMAGVEFHVSMNELRPSVMKELHDTLTDLNAGDPRIGLLAEAFFESTGEQIDAEAVTIRGLVRSAFLALNDTPAEFVGEFLEKSVEGLVPRIGPAVLAQAMMVMLPFPATPFLNSSKAYWMQVAHQMGPDWIDELRRVAAFMDKVESF